MNKMTRWIPVMLTLVAAALLTPTATPDETASFHGEIADTQCALNVHSLNRSHQEMMGMEPSLKTRAECTRFCVKNRGGRYVLQASNKVYRLDKPDQAEPFAGQQVKVVGILDSKTNTIRVQSMALDPSSPSRNK
jgi:hypothetical protein